MKRFVLAILILCCLLTACTGKQPSDTDSQTTAPSVPQPSDTLPPPTDAVQQPTGGEEIPVPSDSVPPSGEDPVEGSTPVIPPVTPTQPPQTPGTAPSEPVFTVTYIGLEGASHNNPATYTATAAGEIRLTPPSQRLDFTFVGWYLGNTRVETLAGYAQNLTLTAKWQASGGAIYLPDIDF